MASYRLANKLTKCISWDDEESSSKATEMKPCLFSAVWLEAQLASLGCGPPTRLQEEALGPLIGLHRQVRQSPWRPNHRKWEWTDRQGASGLYNHATNPIATRWPFTALATLFFFFFGFYPTQLWPVKAPCMPLRWSENSKNVSVLTSHSCFNPPAAPRNPNPTSNPFALSLYRSSHHPEACANH